MVGRPSSRWKQGDLMWRPSQRAGPRYPSKPSRVPCSSYQGPTREAYMESRNPVRPDNRRAAGPAPRILITTRVGEKVRREG
ncbi:hypothetical protein BHM03_00023093 [Ensete ventricosum]|nr:hypothetical protein BHM03_00023093 [Ensete ventricosum]